MSTAATTNMTSRMPARTRSGTPRFESCDDSAEHRTGEHRHVAATITARPKTASRLPRYPVAWRASTSHASTAPEKKVKPSPSRTDTIARAQNGDCHTQSSQYITVVTASVNAEQA